MAGNGTTELIYLIPRALEAKKALVVGPTYSDYRDACTMNQVACDHLICWEPDDFVPDMQAIREAATADLVFLCNPNNPTGALVDRSDDGRPVPVPARHGFRDRRILSALCAGPRRPP
jgi:threonine-phosphate decarboxylase